MKFKEITIDLLYKKDNIREEGNTELADLADSINQYDMLQPILVRPVDGRYEIISGHRRWMAMKMQGANSVPCIIRDDINDEDRVYIQLIENTHRIQMSAMDLVETFDRLKKEHPGLTNAGIAQRLGRPVCWVANQYGAAHYAEKMTGLPQDEIRKMSAGQIVGRARKQGLFGLFKKGRGIKIEYKDKVIRITCADVKIRDKLLNLIDEASKEGL
jgi:ParB/RepB/Spo0J family partition protein